MQNQAIKKMEQECDEKDKQIRKLKDQLKAVQMKNIENENLLRDELDQLSEKNKKLLKVEATVEVLQNRLKELPELRNKLRMTMEQNIKLEETKGEQKVGLEQIEKLQECIQLLKKQKTAQEDATTKAEIEMVKFQNEARDWQRQKQMADETISALNSQIVEM